MYSIGRLFLVEEPIIQKPVYCTSTLTLDIIRCIIISELGIKAKVKPSELVIVLVIRGPKLV
jgi:hypothetical protein